MAISKEQFKKSIDRLKDALAQPKDEFLRDSVIQRFEFCIELSWKTSRKLMGTATSAPKEVIREMAQSAYIDEVETWLLAIDMRNLAAHTYNLDLAEKVYEFAKEFLPQLEKLWGAIEKK